VLIDTGATSNTIGGTTAGAGNVISGNINNAVGLSGAGTSANLVVGNRIGTNAAGTAAVANGGDGIDIVGGATINTVGGTTAGARNLISGNNEGIVIRDFDTTGNVVQGNYIGTDVTGLNALGNGEGVVISDAPGNTIGGSATGAGNIIAGNASIELAITGSNNTATGNVVAGNSIGLAADG